MSILKHEEYNQYYNAGQRSIQSCQIMHALEYHDQLHRMVIYYLNETLDVD